MKNLITLDLTKEGEPTYTTFFYHKDYDNVYKVVSNGLSCAIALRDECGLDKALKHGTTLPKYILNKLVK